MDTTRTAPAPRETTRHRVAITVFLDADGITEKDAYDTGEAALAQALDTIGLTLTTTTYEGYPRTAEVRQVLNTAVALREGALRLMPAGDPH